MDNKTPAQPKVQGQEQRKPFVEPRGEFVEPKIVEAGEIIRKTGGFGTFSP